MSIEKRMQTVVLQLLLLLLRLLLLCCCQQVILTSICGLYSACKHSITLHTAMSNETTSFALFVGKCSWTLCCLSNVSITQALHHTNPPGTMNIGWRASAHRSSSRLDADVCARLLCAADAAPLQLNSRSTVKSSVSSSV